jgi:hypothetical protein
MVHLERVGARCQARAGWAGVTNWGGLSFRYGPSDQRGPAARRRTRVKGAAVDIGAREYTLYPMVVEATIAPGYAGGFYASAFHDAIVDAIRGTGFRGFAPTPGVPDAEIVIRGRVTLMDPGSAVDRYFAPFAGGAVFEPIVQIERAGIDLGEIPAKGVRRGSWFGGDSTELLKDAAVLAGRSAAEKIVALLKAG